ncbi:MULTISPECIES: hypothetical protein [unclassified Burkholderia]|uniref:hypothetical protein n=1 Tax=unclassified Burkholderia TaxID=2613784 RepID=UPI0012E383A6|nr:MULTISPECIES: hypothetical protein [unclassified Burkholderia]
MGLACPPACFGNQLETLVDHTRVEHASVSTWDERIAMLRIGFVGATPARVLPRQFDGPPYSGSVGAFLKSFACHAGLLNKRIDTGASVISIRFAHVPETLVRAIPAQFYILDDTLLDQLILALIPCLLYPQMVG